MTRLTQQKWMLSILSFSLVMGSIAPAFAIWPLHHKAQTDQQPVTPATAPAATDGTTTSPATTTPDANATAAPAPLVPGTNQPGVAVPQVKLQSPLSDEANSLKVEDPVESSSMPLDKSYVAIDDPNNPLGITVSAKKLNDSANLISQKKFKEAEKTINPLKDWLIEATEAHINLYKTLKDIPSAQVQAELEKQLALQFALLRDKAFFQLGMLSLGENDYPNGVKNLSRVIQSQPRSPMGAEAYDVLQKVGFTEKIQLRDESKK